MDIKREVKNPAEITLLDIATLGIFNFGFYVLYLLNILTIKKSDFSFCCLPLDIKQIYSFETF